MAIIKTPDGQYRVDVRPQGRNGKRFRKTFSTRGEAVRYERHIVASMHNKAWVDKPADKRPLSELVELWWEHHGQTLKAGKGNYRKLLRMCSDLGSPRADQINKSLFSDYRAMRLGQGISPATINRTQKLLSGVFTTLIANGLYHAVHPLSGMSQLRTQTSEMAFLTHDDIARLLDALKHDPDSLNVVRVCLATGARWGEAAGLTCDNVMKYKVTFTNTKNGNNRTVPVSENLYKSIMKGKDRMLFPGARYQTVREILKQTVPSLPDGQAVHVLRHTFASHFMMQGGNILTLQKILGHSTIMQTMTYAHFSPDYLQDAVRFNPLESCPSGTRT
ncbi:phage integrase [Salmonella enterica]|uniref:phage integrase n=1 Tax=Salmonella enterica TaxID=28901 RepID=UPI0027E3DE70|nr:tyrosine-type recombinase/integrase [Salmonella enterica]MDQ7464267.1 tyrosine-type recombinase/integrase [Salmonella enterica subsp. enterica serovar Agona]